MATNITYKGSELASFSNNTKTLKTAGKYLEGDITVSASIALGTTTVIPSETAQTINPASGQEGLSSVTVAGITNTYVGSSISRPGSSGIGNSITNGYYKISVSPGYYPGTANKSLGLENPTIIPSETEQVKRPTSNNYYIESVTVAAITPTYVGSGVTTNPTITVSGPSVTIPAGYYSSQQTKTIANGTEGTPTASKTVDTNEAHAIITPSVTNVSGYITGGTKTGPTILVTVRELVSGNTIICDDAGDWDVAECETIEVPEARYFTGMNWGYTTQNNERKFQFLPRTIVDPEEGGQAGWIAEGVYDGLTSTFSAIPKNTVITPSESTQTIGGTNYMMEGPVTVAPVTTGYLKGMLSMPVDIDFSSGHTPTANWTVDTTTGIVTYHAYGSGAITTVVYSSGYIEAGASIPAEYEAGDSYQLPTQGATTITPSSSTQTIAGQKYLTGTITVNPIPSQYIVPSGTYTISSVDSTNTFNVANYASAKVTITDADSIAY